LQLPALDGANPLGFLAALGLLTVGDRIVGEGAWRLSWRKRVVATPILHGVSSVDEVVSAVLADRDLWRTAKVLEHPADDVKMSQGDLRRYLLTSVGERDDNRSLALIAAIVAEGAVDGTGKAKPTDLYFTAGQQRFIEMARRIRDDLSAGHVTEALETGWRYESPLPSLMWDLADDRVYALSATNPATTKKLTNPGAEWLAFLGLSTLPVFASGTKLQTTGCTGSWKNGALTWPNCERPLSHRAASSLIGAVDGKKPNGLEAWSVFRLYRSAIRRSDQGGYGTFAPPKPIWEAE
jgi:hypothetical protein